MNILIVYHSRLGSVESMAHLIARGVESVAGCEAILRSVPEIDNNVADSDVPKTGAPHVTDDDLENCKALILGSPTRFGNMSAAVKNFLDQTSRHWMNATLEGKPAAVFTSSSSMHGGQESTLLSMMLPLFHHGMLISGLPYSEKALHHTQTGGTPYGASHVAGSSNTLPISDDEKQLCIALGKRIGKLAQLLNA